MTVHRRRLLALTLALGLLLSLVPFGANHDTAARAETQRLGITLNEVNVRYGASKSAKIMFSLPMNHVCVILAEKDAEKIHWYRVETINPERKNSNTYYGYIHGDFFRELTPEEYQTYQAGSIVVSTPTPIPTSSGGQPTPTPTPVAPGAVKNEMLQATAGSIGVVTAGGTNLREGPGTGYHSLMKLDRNTQVTLLMIPSVRGPGSGTFFQVNYNNQTGYIMSDYVSILSGGPVSGETIITTPTPTPAPTSSGGSSSGSFNQVMLILSSCHLRTSPGGDYDSENDWLGQGSTLPLAGSSVRQGGYVWYPVSKGGKTYYVRNDCVQPVSAGGGSSAATPTPVPTPEGTVNPNGIGYVRTTKGGCNLRATINGTVIRQIAKNVTLPYLLEPVKKNGYTWYFVQVDDNRGYLRSDVVKVVSAPAVTPTPTPAVTGSAATPTPTPAPTNTPTGWVKTISAGVNLRKNAGYTDRLGQIAKNVVLPYFGAPATVKGVEWYYVYDASLGYGYLHGTYVNLCNEDGSALPTPTPAPGVTTAPDKNSGATEASYSTLKLGSSGTAVKNLVTELKNQGYYSGSVTTRYTTSVESAVKAFQRAKGLSVDGIAGAATQHKLFGTVPIGAGDTSNLTMTLYPAEKIDWYTGGINELWARGSNYKVYDVRTGIVWWAHRWAGGLHVDAEPLTAADTARLCRCYGVSTSQEIKDKNLYQRRPLLVTIGSRTFACSLYGVPHNYPDGDTISNNDFKGQVCIHFTNSQTHDSRKVDSGHEAAIQYAWENAPNGHK